jgi:predicted transcriptional regulator
MKSKLISAKATNIADQSDAIVVSFSDIWHQPLLRREFCAVIRKRIPKSLNAKWLYFHINSPISAICARAEIESFGEISIEKACGISTALGLSVEEIKDYADGLEMIGCYRLPNISNARDPVLISQLGEYMKYHAPQSFFILSAGAKQVIDNLAGFSD